MSFLVVIFIHRISHGRNETQQTFDSWSMFVICHNDCDVSAGASGGKGAGVSHKN